MHGGHAVGDVVDVAVPLERDREDAAWVRVRVRVRVRVMVMVRVRVRVRALSPPVCLTIS